MNSVERDLLESQVVVMAKFLNPTEIIFEFKQLKSILEGPRMSETSASTTLSSDDDVMPVGSTSEDSAGENDSEQGLRVKLVPPAGCW